MEDVVVDEDRRLPGGPDAFHEVQQLLGLLERQAHGRLVEDDDVGLEVQRPDDREALPLAAGQPLDHRVRGQHGGGEAHRLAHELGRHAAHVADLEEAEPAADGTAHEDVAPERELVGEGALLVDGLDAQRAGLLDVHPRDSLAAEVDLAFVRLVDAGDDLDERRLAGAVVTEQADDLAGPELQVHILENVHAPERLRDVAKLQALDALSRGRGDRHKSREDWISKLYRLASAFALASRHAARGSRKRHLADLLR